MKNEAPVISGNLDIFAVKNEILIHGDPEGLRSLATILMKLADTDQEKIAALPIGAREHVHLYPKLSLSKSSGQVIIGRLDAKGTGAFYDRYIAR